MLSTEAHQKLSLTPEVIKFQAPYGPVALLGSVGVFCTIHDPTLKEKESNPANPFTFYSGRSYLSYYTEMDGDPINDQWNNWDLLKRCKKNIETNTAVFPAPNHLIHLNRDAMKDHITDWHLSEINNGQSNLNPLLVKDYLLLIPRTFAPIPHSQVGVEPCVHFDVLALLFDHREISDVAVTCKALRDSMVQMDSFDLHKTFQNALYGESVEKVHHNNYA